MNRQEVINYLKSSAFSNEQIDEIIKGIENDPIAPEYFYRVNIGYCMDSAEHLAFDFLDINAAITFAKKAFLAADYSRVWVEFLENELDTTQSPMIRDLCAPEYTYKSKSNQVYGKKINEFFTEGVTKEEELPFQ